jgi:hypothetical protein
LPDQWESKVLADRGGESRHVEFRVGVAEGFSDSVEKVLIAKKGDGPQNK